ncbi:hypothetical protein S7711_10357 [Stachybotrys chartarum IBT 7711]|uniref:Uncharacterized protein n=1 Tax=Stachybotrys chartarum (strain CBS 109288 / IBT 7711) TaxID=1280523 RepID=A0A084B9G8_STACB|nr:hypothetical protein S7711_10357 [Stachybotrys chartarum IBT 7711]KFA55555.1 hypothetical protein S40293_10572 [Stachybotrys chartarum IBT 40293]KFA71809.1 hypothetical protein S40288_11577 [Stachybotrys chartarum IBT 40288]
MGGPPAVGRAESRSSASAGSSRPEGSWDLDVRQGRRQQTYAQDGGEHANQVKSPDKNPEPRRQGRRRVVGLDTGHNPVGQHAQNRPDDGQEDESGAPVEDARGDAGGDAAEGEAQRVPGAEAGKGDVLAAAGHGVGGAEDADGGRDDHGGGEAEHAAEDVDPVGVLRKGDDEAAGAEGPEAAQQHDFAAQEVGQLPEGQLKGTCCESVERECVS